MTPAEKLKHAIQDAFDETVVELYVQTLPSRRHVSKEFCLFVPSLMEFLAGGSFATGEKFETSALDLYESLASFEQDDVRTLYESKLEEASKRFPKLKIVISKSQESNARFFKEPSSS